MALRSHFLADNGKIKAKITLDATPLGSKKRIQYLAASGIALFVFTVPLLASASVLDWLKGLYAPASASAAGLNSQTITLLIPARSIDPRGPVGGGDIAVVGGTALLPQGGPSGTIADIVEAPESTQISVYTVHEGDTLSGIAAMYGVSVNTIKWANDLQGGTIREGQVLVILPITGVRHTVQKGETLLSIAKKYKGDLDEIAGYNNISPSAALAVGTTVIIPDGTASAPAPRRSAPVRGSGGPAVAGYYGWPVEGGIVTQGLHGYNGIDIGARGGTSILASAAGTVLIARSGGWNGGYGSYVVIQHDNGTQTLYAHLSSVAASAGQYVVRGQTIGGMGATGKATGVHLHFEVRGAQNPFR